MCGGVDWFLVVPLAIIILYVKALGGSVSTVLVSKFQVSIRVYAIGVRCSPMILDSRLALQ